MKTPPTPPNRPNRSLIPGNFKELQGYTVRELANLLGVPDGTVYNWERAEGHTLQRICPVCTKRKEKHEMRGRPHRSCKKCPAVLTGIGHRIIRGRKVDAFKGLDHDEIRWSLAMAIAGFYLTGKTAEVGPSPQDPKRPWTAESLGGLHKPS